MEIFNCILASCALLISLYNIYRNYSMDRYNKKMGGTNLEKDLLNDINKQRERFTSITADFVKMGELTDDQKKIYQGQINEVMESYLNRLDYACQKYNDGIIDKDSFETNFSELIKQASQDENVLTIVSDDKRNKYKHLKQAFLKIKKD